MKRRRILTLLLAGVILASLLAACNTEDAGPGSSPGSTPGASPSPSASAGGEQSPAASATASADPDIELVPYRDHVNLILGQAPDTLDPQMYNNAAAGSVCAQIFDSLYYFSAMHGEHPRLALSYDVSGDGLIYTYHLRPGVVFSDGSPFTADDVVFTFGRLRPDQNRDAMLKEVVAVDELTVEFRLNMVNATFHSGISTILIASEAAVAAAGDEVGVKPVGTGPFMLDPDSFLIDQHITVKRNPSHWDHDAVQIQSATFFVITDALTQYNAFEAGDIDMLAVGADQWPGVLDSGKYNTVMGPIGITTYIVFNTETSPWSDVRVRRAFNYAVDNELVVALALNGLGTPAVSAAPPGVIGGAVLPDDPYRYDPQRAKALFAEAGVTDIGKISTVAGVMQSILEIVQQNLQDIGIAMDIDILDSAALTAARNSGNFTAATLGIYLTLEFNQYAVIYASDGILNLSRLANPKIDELFLTASTTIDTEKRFAIYRQIINLASEDARHHYFTHAIFTYAYHPRLAQTGGEDGAILLRRFAWDLVEVN